LEEYSKHYLFLVLVQVLLTSCGWFGGSEGPIIQQKSSNPLSLKHYEKLVPHSNVQQRPMQKSLAKILTASRRQGICPESGDGRQGDDRKGVNIIHGFFTSAPIRSYRRNHMLISMQPT
jgi:hypothetical protein